MQPGYPPQPGQPPQAGYPAQAVGSPSAYPGPAAAAAGPVSTVGSAISWVIVAVCVVIIIAANLPWASLGGLVSVAGTDGGRDGWITLVIAVIVGVVAAVSAIIRKSSRIHLSAGIVAVIGGLLVTLIGIIDIADTSDKGLDVGIGLTLTLIFGIILLVAGIVGIVKRR